MLEPCASVSVVIDGHASDLAFGIGQRVETLLIDDAVALARAGGGDDAIVTEDHVYASVAKRLPDDLRLRIGIRTNAEPGEARALPA